MFQKAFASKAVPRRPTPTQEVNFCFWLSASIIGPWETSLPFVTPISGYAYVRVSNNKQ